MLDLTQRFANALLDYAEGHGLEHVYRQVLIYVTDGCPPNRVPESLKEFMPLITSGGGDVDSVLEAFLELAQERMNMLKCEILSAVPLKPEQLARLEQKLIRMFRKRLNITVSVDPSLLGGVRIIAGHTVLDDTIKHKLSQMKSSIYEGVYLNR